jgi:hypothetical protein
MSGAGSAATLAQAQTLTAHAEHLQDVVAASTVNAAGTYGTAWSGAGATAAQAAHTQVNTALAALAEWVAEKPPIITAAAQAYHTAVSEMVPAEEAVANRTQEAADVEVNPRVLGALTPQIAALNLDYFGYMWPANAGAGASYGAVLRSGMAALLTPPPPANPAASPQAAASADDDAMAASGQAMRQARQSAREPLSRAATVQPPPPAVQAPPARLAEMRPPAAAAPQPPPVGMYQRPPPIAAVNGAPTPAGGTPGTATSAAGICCGGFSACGVPGCRPDPLHPARRGVRDAGSAQRALRDSQCRRAAATTGHPIQPDPTGAHPRATAACAAPAGTIRAASTGGPRAESIDTTGTCGTGSSRAATTLTAQHRQPHTDRRAAPTRRGSGRCADAGRRPHRTRTTTASTTLAAPPRPRITPTTGTAAAAGRTADRRDDRGAGARHI